MVTLPVVITVFTAMTVGIGAGVTSYRLHHVAHDHARVLSLGGDPSFLPGVPEGARSRTWRADDLVCVSYEKTLEGGVMRLFPITLDASACALAPADD